MSNWIIITAKFSSICYICGEWIDKGDTAYWKKLEGVKHYSECKNFGIPDEDKTQLIIDDQQDEDFYLK